MPVLTKSSKGLGKQIKQKLVQSKLEISEKSTEQYEKNGGEEKEKPKKRQTQVLQILICMNELTLIEM